MRKAEPPQITPETELRWGWLEDEEDMAGLLSCRYHKSWRKG